jgi:hypothetical protein
MSLESSDSLIAAKTLPNQCQCASFVIVQHPARTAKLTQCHVAQVALIEVLPDDVLLEIFDFYMDEDEDGPTKKGTEAWQPLVHVCQRWRSVVFGSPRRLDLRLVCTPKTPVKETLNIWPPFPLLISGRVSRTSGVDNIVAILKHRDRTRKIHLEFSKSQWGDIYAMMQVQFPGLTYLRLKAYDASYLTNTVRVLPNSFLGGSAPHLQTLDLCHIPFLGLPKLLLSATHLVTLRLHGPNSPHYGIISPEVMATCLSALTSLETFWLEFEFPPRRLFPEGGYRLPSPPTGCVLPALTRFKFDGANNEYLAVLVDRIDPSRLEVFQIFLYEQDFYGPHLNLVQFISHTPKLVAHKKAHVVVNGTRVEIILSSQKSGDGELTVVIRSDFLDFQLASMAQLFTSFLPPFPTLEELYISEYFHLKVVRYGDVGDDNWNTLWLDFLRPFAGVKDLYISKQFAFDVVRALQELVGDGTTEVLPALKNLFPGGRPAMGICSEGYSGVCYCTTALRSSCRRFPLGKDEVWGGRRLIIVSFLRQKSRYVFLPSS